MAKLTEEQVVQMQNESDRDKLIKVYSNIPYTLMKEEDKGNAYLGTELTQIGKYYRDYLKGVEFYAEGSNSDYVPADLKFKLASTLIDMQARFMFGEKPEVSVMPKGDIGKVSEEAKEHVNILDDLVNTILEKNKFEGKVLMGARDSLIGKRVACLLNFNNTDGITLNFIRSTNFVFKSENDRLVKFVCFNELNAETLRENKRYFKKKYELIDEKVYLTEMIYDGLNNVVEVIAEKKYIPLSRIPAVVIVYSKLSNDVTGLSDMDEISDFEAYYNKLSNADIDAERKSMNPTKYTINMDSNSTENLSTGAGSFWDLAQDQNLEYGNASVGILEPSMHYKDALKDTTERIKTSAYERVGMPNVTLETLQGVITSGKSLKAIYWSAILRCKEMMKTWIPAIKDITNIIIEGCYKFPDIVKKFEYSKDTAQPVEFKIVVTPKSPLPEDTIEEKSIDLEEVANKTMSRKAYMKKWRNLTDEEISAELEQIALEQQLIEEVHFMQDSFQNTDFDA